VNIRLIAVGKLREPYIAAAAGDFRTRLRPYFRLEELEVRDVDALLRALEPAEPFWLLERSGTQMSSEALAARLARMQVEGSSRLAIAIAGAFGASPALIERANFLWSLSELTFLHEWARAIVLEQLYRAAKIIRNEPYHH
jgi:23S rRNA (pseudouridine1915-N3)-methyltransferase